MRIGPAIRIKDATLASLQGTSAVFLMGGIAFLPVMSEPLKLQMDFLTSSHVLRESFLLMMMPAMLQA